MSSLLLLLLLAPTAQKATRPRSRRACSRSSTPLRWR